MTLKEFKAWFEEFSEGVKGAPDKAQWDLICSKIDQMSGFDQFNATICVDRMLEKWL